MYLVLYPLANSVNPVKHVRTGSKGPHRRQRNFNNIGTDDNSQKIYLINVSVNPSTKLNKCSKAPLLLLGRNLQKYLSKQLKKTLYRNCRN